MICEGRFGWKKILVEKGMPQDSSGPLFYGSIGLPAGRRCNGCKK